MISLLWAKEIEGRVGHALGQSVITVPRLGGWWTRYDAMTGEVIWRQHHRKPGSFFALQSDVIVGTTDHGSGIYAIDHHTGRKLWTRLGGWADPLLKLFEYLPCENEGDGPCEIVTGQIVTMAGRILNPTNGRVVGREKVQSYYQRGRGPARYFYGGIPTSNETHEGIEQLLSDQGLELGGPQWCALAKGSCIFVVACRPPEQYRTRPRSRPYSAAKPADVPYVFMILRAEDNAILFQEEVGSYFTAEFSWASEYLVLELQNSEQRAWDSERRRDVRIYRLPVEANTY
ncbi:PQQ-binding-like beta-propeller repeat protein [Roseimicrobium sp. ORNL1]|uniref:outer membrane protein assembly factor BamB family protein n=1 Tax=Roseimicrobium sp. ORNL1 TaxID=2711231 RepID=UPI0013E182F1|nr:PQQ-binding-like beta-propeller repeat protein [Roseimicrobium sp. ORNL1]QIF02688.1 PQQ-binding-like beta-propeller repeat protein [Roseimicrobium sp. ORNL1]